MELNLRMPCDLSQKIARLKVRQNGEHRKALETYQATSFVETMPEGISVFILELDSFDPSGR